MTMTTTRPSNRIKKKQRRSVPRSRLPTRRRTPRRRRRGGSLGVADRYWINALYRTPRNVVTGRKKGTY